MASSTNPSDNISKCFPDFDTFHTELLKGKFFSAVAVFGGRTFKWEDTSYKVHQFKMYQLVQKLESFYNKDKLVSDHHFRKKYTDAIKQLKKYQDQGEAEKNSYNPVTSTITDVKSILSSWSYDHVDHLTTLDCELKIIEQQNPSHEKEPVTTEKKIVQGTVEKTALPKEDAKKRKQVEFETTIDQLEYVREKEPSDIADRNKQKKAIKYGKKPAPKPMPKAKITWEPEKVAKDIPIDTSVTEVCDILLIPSFIIPTGQMNIGVQATSGMKNTQRLSALVKSTGSDFSALGLMFLLDNQLSISDSKNRLKEQMSSKIKLKEHDQEPIAVLFKELNQTIDFNAFLARNMDQETLCAELQKHGLQPKKETIQKGNHIESLYKLVTEKGPALVYVKTSEGKTRPVIVDFIKYGKTTVAGIRDPQMGTYMGMIQESFEKIYEGGECLLLEKNK